MSPGSNGAHEVGVASEPEPQNLSTILILFLPHRLPSRPGSGISWMQLWFQETEGSELQGSLEIVLIHLLMSRMANLRAIKDKETEALVLF